jgi:nanoRNase/pAp phosphatase (c-di-AMP/oligoRNAs hydrolase)
MNQDSAVPTNKVQAAGIAGAATILIVFICQQLGLEVPPEAASALTTLIAFTAGYFRREAPPAGTAATTYQGQRGHVDLNLVVQVLALVVVVVLVVWVIRVLV